MGVTFGPPQRQPAGAEDCHDAASHRPASHRDSGLADGTAFEVLLEGAEFPDPEAEEAARTEEAADRVEEADPPPEVEAADPQGEGQERRWAEGASTSRPSSRPRPRPSRPSRPPSEE